MSDSKEKARAAFEAQFSADEEELRKLAGLADAEFVFSSYTFYTVIGAAKEKRDEPVAAKIEAAAHVLMPYFGCGSCRDNKEVKRVSDLLDKRFTQRCGHIYFSETNKDPIGDIVADLQIYAQTIRGTAFSAQSLARIDALFAPFETYFTRNYGIGPMRAAKILTTVAFTLQSKYAAEVLGMKSIVRRGTELLNKADRSVEEETEFSGMNDRAQKWANGAPERWPVTPEELHQRLPDLTTNELVAMIEHFGYSPAVRDREPDPVSVQDRPLFILSRGQMLMSHVSPALDAVFSFFDDVIRTDPTMRDRYGKHVAYWMETQIEAYALRVFPKGCYLREACYSNPDPKGGETSADGIILWGPFLVVVEAKGRAFKRRSLRGDVGRLKSDLAHNIEGAFSQTQRLARALQKTPTLRLKEKGTGRELLVERDKLQRIFPVSVTLFHFAGLATQLASVKPLGLFRNGDYPWSVSIDDLDVITRFARYPDAFLHYIERRLEIQRADTHISADELDLFGHYLDARLHPAAYWKHKELVDHSGPVHVTVSGGAERFDDYFNAQFLGNTSKTQIKLDLPPVIDAILEDLRGYSEAGARWTAFALLGLSHPALLKLAELIGKFNDPRLQHAPIPRLTIPDGEVLIVIMGNRGHDYETFSHTLHFRTSIEKYRTRKKTGIGLGLNLCPGPQFVCGAYYESGEWDRDEIMEDLLMKDGEQKKKRLSFNGKRPGRNDRCVCGSGKKFKHCCDGKIQFL